MSFKTISNKGLIASILFLTAISAVGKDYKGAELRTKESYLYGRFEVKYKASWGSGQTSTFFTYNDDNPNTPWNEIDIEILGRYTDEVQYNTITPRQLGHVRHQFVDFDPTLDFHVYAFEWTPDYVAWFIDGVEVARQTQPHVQTLSYPQKIMMNIWNPVYDNWVGPFDDRQLPFFAYYDHVSYASYTPGTGNTGTGNNFTHQWADSFSEWDTDRWEKATHTFSGNNCDFIHENCVFRDGKMILCLTDDTNLGYVDKNAPAVLYVRALNGSEIQVQFSEAVDQSTAEKVTNYAISGVTVDNAELMPDNRSVKLTVSGMDTALNYQLIAHSIQDVASSPNSLLGQVVEVIRPDPLEFPALINAGGPEILGYLPDQQFTFETEYGRNDGYAHSSSDSQPIAGTDLDVIYRTALRGAAAYRIRVPDGTYDITLMMCENDNAGTGDRLFDVFIEGNKVINAIDVAGESGLNTALDRKIEDVVVKDGQLDIHFGSIADEPIINGIRIESTTQGISRSREIPEDPVLCGNFPNPFNDSTVITYHLPVDGNVSLRILDTTGREIDRVVEAFQDRGEHEIIWDGAHASGVYFYRLDFRDGRSVNSRMGKMVLMK